MRTYPTANGGFSLVEIMIGLLISIISTLVVVQVYSTFNAQKRTVSAGGDAQINGAIGLYTLLRDVRQAGYATGNFNLLGCDVVLGAAMLTAMAPVTINHAAIPAGDANTDTLLVVYGNGAGSPEGDGFTAPPTSQTVFPMQTLSAFTLGDRVIVAPPVAASAACAGLTLNTVAGTTIPNLTVASAVSGVAVTWRIYNLGLSPKVLVYAIRGGNLSVCDYMANDCGADANKNNTAIWVPIVSNIVSLRAQYGRDTGAPMDGTADIYDQTTPVTNCGWARTSTVRMVLVARSSQPDISVTSAAPSWAATAADNPAGSASLAVDLSATAVPASFTWQNFRYNVFETTVPIRNIMIMGVQTGC